MYKWYTIRIIGGVILILLGVFMVIGLLYYLFDEGYLYLSNTFKLLTLERWAELVYVVVLWIPPLSFIMGGYEVIRKACRDKKEERRKHNK